MPYRIDSWSERHENKQSWSRNLPRERIERSIFGCAYGATSFTTRDEAENVGKMLALGPEKRLLEVGTGSGWPGFYLASITGCDVALIDLPFEGLRIAAARAAQFARADVKRSQGRP